jgi:DNA polymerase V
MGDAMTGANIFAKDLLVIERLSDYRDGCIILAFVDGQRLVRKLEKREAYLPLRSS